MVETVNEKIEIAAVEVAPATQPNSILRSSRFKYYIHDGIDACRFQLIGELTQADLPELNGCWRTAKTMLGNRNLLLDLRGLKSVDEAGRKWVSSMVDQGAQLLPDALFQHSLPVSAESDTFVSANEREPGRFGKLCAMLRNLRVRSPESSTQAR